MKEPIDNYFTTGELAKLCKIPRKTLLYYDSLGLITPCLLYTSPSPRDRQKSRMPSSA